MTSFYNSLFKTSGFSTAYPRNDDRAEGKGMNTLGKTVFLIGAPRRNLSLKWNSAKSFIKIQGFLTYNEKFQTRALLQLGDLQVGPNAKTSYPSLSPTE